MKKDEAEDGDSPAEEKPATEMTLDEWKKRQKSNLKKKQFNIRRPGEGNNFEHKFSVDFIIRDHDHHTYVFSPTILDVKQFVDLQCNTKYLLFEHFLAYLLQVILNLVSSLNKF